MKKLVLAFATCSMLMASPPDVLKTSTGDIKITPVLHGTVLLEIQGKAWYIDPWGKADYSSLPKADGKKPTTVFPLCRPANGIGWVFKFP